MIRPRPTQHLQSLGLDGGHIYKSNDPRHDRPIVYCSVCGAKLSRYRPAGATLCAPHEQQAIFRALPEELHPPIPTAWDRQRKANQ